MGRNFLDTLYHALSGVARTFPVGRAAHPKDQNEEENEENLRQKMRETTGKSGKMEKMFFSCPPGSESLATALHIQLQIHSSAMVC